MKRAKKTTVPRPRIRDYPAPLLILAGVAILVFAQALWFPFVTWDDGIHVYENPLVNHPGLSSLLAFWSAPYEGLYMPLTYTVWTVLAVFSGRAPDGNLAPFLFHAATILFHALNTCLVFLILRELAPKERKAEPNPLPELAGALLFAVHPFQVESVAWVTGLKEILFASFGLVTLYLYLASEKYFLAAVACSFSAALSKPTGVVVPLVVAWLEACRGMPRPRLVRRFGPWCAAMLPLVLIAQNAQPPIALAASSSLPERFLVAGDALFFYVRQCLFPYRLVPQYDHSLAKTLASPALYFTGVAPYLACLATLLVKRLRPLRLPAGLFIIPILPVLGLVPFWYQKYSTVADHYLYLPLLGASLLFARGLALRPRKATFAEFSPFSMRSGFALAVLIALSARTVAQTPVWRDGKTLALYMLQYHPDATQAHLNLGIAYRDEHRLDLAMAELKKAIAIDPEYPEAYLDLGSALGEQNCFAEAAEKYARAHELKPGDGVIELQLAKALAANGQLEEAGPHFVAALKARPDLELEAHLFIAQVLGRQGRADAAATHLKAALAINPYRSDVHAMLGNAFASLGNSAEAVREYDEALRLNPGNDMARMNKLAITTRAAEGRDTAVLPAH